jgi:glycopeptide antibiotics resistance protein
MPQERSESHRVVAGLICAGGLGAALYLTLFPFDFFTQGPLSPQAVLARFDLNFISRYTLKDFPRNVLLFMPIGLGLAGLLPLRWPRPARLGLTLLVGLAFSAGIEVGQSFLHDRFSAAADVLANGLGALAGAALLETLGRASLGLVVQLAGRLAALLTPRLAVAAMAGWLAIVMLVATTEQGRARTANWEPGFALLLGNEIGGGRQWRGAVGELYLADVALDRDGIERVFAGADPAALLAGAGLAHYALAPDGSYVERGGREPPLLPQAGADGGRWWQSAAPPVALSRAIAGSSQLTLIVDVAPASADQGGPARIVTLSDGPFRYNLTLGQEGPDLVLRIRNGISAAGRFPELRVAGSFAEPRPRRVAVTLAAATARVYIDGPRQLAGFAYHPAVTLFLGRPPVSVAWFYAERLPLWIYQALFAALAYGPISLLALSGSLPIRGVRGRVLAVAVAPPLAALLVEGAIARISGGGIDRAIPLLGAALGVGAAGLLALRGRRRRRPCAVAPAAGPAEAPGEA